VQDRPTAEELVLAVREFLTHDVMPSTEGRVRFHARVATNVLGMVERELSIGPELLEAERDRAAAILEHDGDVRDLERELAEGIRTGAFDHRLDDVRLHVRATVRDKLLIANPSYLPDHERAR